MSTLPTQPASAPIVSDESGKGSKKATLSGAVADPSVREIRAHMPEDRRDKSTLVGTLLFLNTTLLYSAAFIGIAAAPNWFLKTLLSVMSGVLISILFTIGHDACHQSLTPKNGLNKFLGRLAFLPSLHSFTAWDYKHNSLHHSYTNLRGRDPVYAPFSKAEYDALPYWRRGLERFYRSPLGVGMFYFVEAWWKQIMFPSHTDQVKMRTPKTFQMDRLLVFGFFLAQIVVLLSLDHQFHPASAASPVYVLSLIAVGIVLPQVVWNWLMGFATFQHHTHPGTRWYADEQEWSFFKGHLQGTVHVKFPRFIEVMLHNIMDHTAHHVDPRIPLYKLTASQEGLEKAYTEDIIVQVWNLREFFNTMRRCRLYDYKNHHWLDFDGKTTT